MQFQFLDNQEGHHRKDTGCRHDARFRPCIYGDRRTKRREPTNWNLDFVIKFTSKCLFTSILSLMGTNEK